MNLMKAKEEETKPGTFYLVSTPIGNDDDITLRAIKVLKLCDIIVCEELKIGGHILKRHSITKVLESLNEQNEFEKSEEFIRELQNGKNIALISDAGTPVFADPGYVLVREAIRKNIKITVVPGPSSIMTALLYCGFSINQFLYAGFLSREREERFAQLKRLRDEARTVVLLETPYRLMPVLEAASKILGNRRAYIGCNLTMPFETHHYGTFSELYEKFEDLRFKGEFVIVFEGFTPDMKFINRQEFKSDKQIRAKTGTIFRDRDNSRKFTDRRNKQDFSSERYEDRKSIDYKKGKKSGDKFFKHRKNKAE